MMGFKASLPLKFCVKLRPQIQGQQSCVDPEKCYTIINNYDTADLMFMSKSHVHVQIFPPIVGAELAKGVLSVAIIN